MDAKYARISLTSKVKIFLRDGSKSVLQELPEDKSFKSMQSLC